MSSPVLSAIEPGHDVESGYASGESQYEGGLTDTYFTKPHLKYINQQLAQLEPKDILQWCLITLPGLFQTTAFGLTGLVTIDILSKLCDSLPTKPKVDLIFLDTFYHFRETHDLVDKIRIKYPQVNLNIYKPAGVETVTEFEEKYGPKLWETNEELYDWVAKVEPAQRAYRNPK